MNVTYKNFVDQLVHSVPELLPYLNEHKSDYEGVLPHVFMGEVSRLIIQLCKQETPTSEILIRKIFDAISNFIDSPDPMVQELLVVSFIENIDSEGRRCEIIKNFIEKFRNRKCEINNGMKR